MQSIIDHNTVIHPIFDDIKRLYAVTSTKNTGGTLIPPVFSDCFRDVFSLFSEFGGVTYDVDFTPSKYEKLKLPKYDPKNIIVCFSGGKDSIATVLHYQKLGYNVYGYYLRHINFALSDEFEIAEQCAQKLNIPLFVDEITLSGHNDWVEHPCKNMIIANGALSYGIRNNVGIKVAFGNYYTSSVVDDNFGFCGSDDIETWRAYEKIIQQIIPKFHIYICLKNLGSALNQICNRPELLDYSVSCIGRANLRSYKRNWVKQKFDVDLPKYRCGQCYKCCVEYIYMADHGLQKYNAEYYKYCIEKLRRNLWFETGRSQFSFREVFYNYFFYDMKKSKYLKENNYGC